LPKLEVNLYITKMKAGTKIEEVKDKNGDVVERKIITTVAFETEGVPDWLPKVLHFQANGNIVSVMIYSEQSVMDDIAVPKD